MSLKEEVEKEQQLAVEALKKFREELLAGKANIMSEVRINKTQVEEAVHDLLPKNHEQSHEDIRKFLEHSPDAKIHGDHHDFTESVREKIEQMVLSIFKALGGIILIALLVGLYSWVKHQV